MPDLGNKGYGLQVTVDTGKLGILWRGQKASLDAEHVARLKQLQGAVWIHAASVGEFEQARPLIEQLKIKNSKLKIAVTFFSPSGYEVRKNYPLADAVLYLPFATRANARAFLDALQPSIAIFVKYEFWPAYLKELRAREIPTYSISAIFREKQIFFRWWGKYMLDVLRCFTHIYVQDEASLQLLNNHGVMQASIAGDTRFDRVQAVKDGLKTDDPRLIPVMDFVGDCQRVLVAGSTWPQDEELLARYADEHPECKIILVPHEIDDEHLHTIFNIFQGRFVRYTALSGERLTAIGTTRHNIIQHANVLVMDTMGLLSSVYRFGQVAYVGGGFGVGIHNTIEAAVYGVPVLFGPNYLHFREAKGLIAVGAARSIANYPELEAALETAFEQHSEIGQKAAEYVASELGATDKIYKEIF